MNSRFFLNYSKENLEIIDELIQHAIALYFHANIAQELQDETEINYDISLSMREWCIKERNESTRIFSKWSLPGRENTLILDSTMRDQHIVSLKIPNENEIQIKIGISSPIENDSPPLLFSLYKFSKINSLKEISYNAKSQVRWISIPGGGCDGVLTSIKGRGLSFIPINIQPGFLRNFSENEIYDAKYLFDYI